MSSILHIGDIMSSYISLKQPGAILLAADFRMRLLGHLALNQPRCKTQQFQPNLRAPMGGAGALLCIEIVAFGVLSNGESPVYLEPFRSSQLYAPHPYLYLREYSTN